MKPIEFRGTRLAALTVWIGFLNLGRIFARTWSDPDSKSRCLGASCEHSVANPTGSRPTPRVALLIGLVGRLATVDVQSAIDNSTLRQVSYRVSDLVDCQR